MPKHESKQLIFKVNSCSLKSRILSLSKELFAVMPV